MTSSTKFQGACEELKEHVYDTSPFQASSELFTKTTTAIGEYVVRKYVGTSEFRNGLPTMTLPQLNPPTNPTVGDAVALEIWKLDIQEYRKRVLERERNMGKIYSLILGQCAPTIRDQIEASSDWADINSKSDAIRLLTLIRQSLYQRATHRQNTHTLIEAETALLKFHQNKRMSNSDYLERLRELIEVYEHLGGEPGVSKSRIRDRLQDPDKATPQEQAKAKAEYMAVLLLKKAIQSATAR